MFSIKACDLPSHALLTAYRERGAYTDCYIADVNGQVSQADYIRAFYTTVPFKLERFVLKWVVSKPSTDEDATRLAEANQDTFAAWSVEGRAEDQILLSDFRGRTRSWLMSEPSGDCTRLYFGSAVVPLHSAKSGERRMGTAFRPLLQFHKLYSQVLLAAARSKLSKLQAGT